MSAISGFSGYNANLLPFLSQAEGGSSNPSLLNSLIPGGLQAASQGSSPASTALGSSLAGTSSSLQNQIQSAVTTALQGAEQSGNPDLKGVVYSTLVQVLQDNGIDPKTLQPTSNSSQSGNSGTTSAALDSTTSS